jgi:hypothetical protein
MSMRREAGSCQTQYCHSSMHELGPRVTSTRTARRRRAPTWMWVHECALCGARANPLEMEMANSTSVRGHFLPFEEVLVVYSKPADRPQSNCWLRIAQPLRKAIQRSNIPLPFGPMPNQRHGSFSTSSCRPKPRRASRHKGSRYWRKQISPRNEETRNALRARSGRCPRRGRAGTITN